MAASNNYDSFLSSANGFAGFGRRPSDNLSQPEKYLIVADDNVR
jgi:hypothetical protein